MINVHLNGDIVRCPDIAAIKLREWEIKDKNEICRYNIKESTCPTWQNNLKNWQNVKDHSNCGRCPLAGTAICPGHQTQQARGKKEKTFGVNGQNYRKLASAAHYLVKESDNKVLFLTLTFPKFKKQVSNNEINNYFSKFVENLRANYNCGGYVAVREFGKKANRVHFHLLISIPFIRFPVLNAIWCNCIKDICYSSKNAVTSDPKTRFITNPGRALRYVCKYFAKTKGQFSASRLIFLSNNLVQKPRRAVDFKYYPLDNYWKPKDILIEDLLKGYKSIYIQQTSDYTTCYRITDINEFNRFCDEFLYPFFELSIKKSGTLYAFPGPNP